MRVRTFLAVAAFATTSLSLGACANQGHDSPGTTSTVAETPSPPSAYSSAVWPIESGPLRYATPEQAAQGFATDYLKISNPVIDSFQQGDSRSGEVPIRPTSTGPVTTVMVRQLGSASSWWVVGAGTDAIQLSEPKWGASISSPVALVGAAGVFEGTVQTQIRQSDDGATVLGAGIVTGGMAMTPFSGVLTFSKPSTQRGAVVLFTLSPKDGSVLEASVTQITFG
ncbi:MAG: Gmad2 immunoglobulin-like domain-containing protein [Actinomycetes bacterium]